MPFPELYFNADNGYLEGLVRGFKAGILSQADYLNLVQCETLEDLKLHLQSTDYGSFLSNEASPLVVSVIDDKLKEKMVVEFRHMRNQSYEPLASFMDFITYSYMIDNVILLITGTLHQRAISELVPKCHPLGSFEQMEAVNIAQTPAELYNAILVDTPLAAFFQDCISEQDLDEMNIEIIRNTLYKATSSLSTSSVQIWEEPQRTRCAPFWSLKQTAEPSSSPSTPLGRSCRRRIEPNSSLTVGSCFLRDCRSSPEPTTTSK